MKKTPKVSIIIPVIAINDYIRESVPKMLELNWPDFEIIIYPDEPDTKHKFDKTRIIASGKVGPAEKRDLATRDATGEILAFLDDDAYPNADWLERSIPHFNDKKVAAVGGPAITPKNDDTLQKVSGAVFESYLGGATSRDRYLPIGKVKPVYDWPTVNLLVRKSVFDQIGGFDNTYWPGEDTKLCLDITHAGYSIIYEPSAIVHHHRRSDLIKHFKQIGNYALHRGYFAKIYPETSRRPAYFIPTLFDLYLLALIFFLVLYDIRFTIYDILPYIPLGIYAFGLLIDFLIISFRHCNPLIGLITMPMILCTHIWYGIKFIQGLLTKNLAR